MTKNLVLDPRLRGDERLNYKTTTRVPIGVRR